ncbi:MAG: UbiD family decarboxylase [Anaerolineales bacterium]|nr:MAG: UbiD family decarboxylase [Anaerolineales bacterium]
MNLRDLIDQVRKAGHLVEVNTPTCPDPEMARLVYRYDGRPVLFDNVSGYPGWRVLAGVASTREYFAMALNVPVEGLIHKLVAALEKPVAPPVVQDAPCQEVVESDVDLTRLPILRHFPSDGGPYVTAGILVVNDPDYGRNVSFHRLLRLDERRFAARVVEKRGTDTALSKSMGALPVAICIGNSLPVLLAASMSPPMGVDELAVANALSPVSVVPCHTIPLHVPSDCELVLEGHLTRTSAPEGPFVDLTETMDFVRRGPVIEIDCITHRHDPIYQALLPGKLEHKLLMGMPKEPTILAAVSRVCHCTNVVITPGGASWLHAVVQIEKKGSEDGRAAIQAAFQGHGSLKHVVVVDTDVNPYDPLEVEWAIATRFQADRNLLILTDQPGSSLDPSGVHEPGKKARTAKMGLDATIPWGADRVAFEKVRY